MQIGSGIQRTSLDASPSFASQMPPPGLPLSLPAALCLRQGKRPPNCCGRSSRHRRRSLAVPRGGGKGASAPVRWLEIGSYCSCLHRRPHRAAPTANIGLGAVGATRVVAHVQEPARCALPLRCHGAGSPLCPLSGGCRPQGGWGLFQCQCGSGHWENPASIQPPPLRGAPWEGAQGSCRPTGLLRNTPSPTALARQRPWLSYNRRAGTAQP